jgi:hypothetical protein
MENQHYHWLINNGLIKISFQLFNKEELLSLKQENSVQQLVQDHQQLITLEIGYKEPTENGLQWQFHLMENMEFQKDLSSHIQL